MGRGDVGSAGLSAVAAPSYGPAGGRISWHDVPIDALRPALVGAVTTSGSAAVRMGLQTGSDERLVLPTDCAPSRRLQGVSSVCLSPRAERARAPRRTPLPYHLVVRQRGGRSRCDRCSHPRQGSTCRRTGPYNRYASRGCRRNRRCTPPQCRHYRGRPASGR
jgi:hypothetical protein